MKLYYSPGACSLASHVALAEGGVDYATVRVDLSSHRTENGDDFYDISERGYVPALDTNQGLITENAAVLMYLSDNVGTRPDGMPRYRILEWLSYAGTELHAKGFGPIFKAMKAGDHDARDQAKGPVAERLEQAARLMGDGDWLVLDQPTVADNYLFVMTLWADKFRIDTPDRLKAFRARNMRRDAVTRAMKAEGLI